MGKCMIVRVIGWLACFLSMWAPIRASEPPPPLLHPTTYRSPNGEWSLLVDPTQRYGEGDGRYVLRRGDKVAWEGMRPITLQDAVVSDAGFIGGYAYTHGWRDPRARGTFHVAIFSPSGEVILDETVKRFASRQMHAAPRPVASHLFLHPELDRLVVDVADSQEATSRWWCYEMSSGRLVYKRSAVDLLATDIEAPPESHVYRGMIGAYPIRGTPLTLVQWWRSDFERRPARFGTHFVVVDAELAPLWDLLLADDFAFAENEDRQDRLRSEARSKGTVLAVGERQFTTRLVADRSKVTWNVVPDREAKDHWLIVESERAAYEPPAAATAVVPPEVALRSLGTTKLGEAPSGARPEIRDVQAFEVEAGGNLRFIRGEDAGGASCVAVSVLGVVERAVAVVGLVDGIEGRRLWTPLSGGRWLFTISPFGVEARTRAWLVDERDGRAVEIEGFDCPSVSDVAALGHGGFAVLATFHLKYTMQDVVRAYDAGGGMEWQVESTTNSNGPLFSPNGLCVTPSGDVAVVETITNRVQIFAPVGTLKASINLEAAWGRKPRYPVGIEADPAGGFLVFDSSGEPRLVHMRSDGTVVSSFDPLREDGGTSPELARNARFAPDGRVWTTDGRSFSRLDAKGTADLTVGPKPDADALTEPARAAFDRNGRVLVLDRRTGATHAFTREGTKSFVCRPDVADLSQHASTPEIAEGWDGSILVRSSRAGFIQFDAQGQRKRAHSLRAQDVAPAAESDRVWCSSRGGIVLADEDGSEVRKIERRPDGRWFESIADVATANDGGLVVLCDGSPPSHSLALAVFSPTGEPIEMIKLGGVNAGDLATTPKWVVVSRYGAEAWLIKRSDGAVRRLAPASDGAESSTRAYGFAPDGTELWVVELPKLVLERFALPD